jgi:hypothetical protein
MWLLKTCPGIVSSGFAVAVGVTHSPLTSSLVGNAPPPRTVKSFVPSPLLS